MKTKKLLRSSFIILTVIFSMQAKAITHLPFKAANATGINKDDSFEVAQMEQRVSEIQNMDIANMSFGQKHSLRVEIKQMIRREKEYNRHPYLVGNIASGGVLIIMMMALYVMLLH